MGSDSPAPSAPNSFDSSKTLDFQTPGQGKICHANLGSSSVAGDSSTWSVGTLRDDDELLDDVFDVVEENEDQGSETGDGEESNCSPKREVSSYGPWLKSCDIEERSLAFNVKPSALGWGAWPSRNRPVEVESESSVVSWLSENNKPLLSGAGFANLGNTCFLNSVLQCFIHTVPLLQRLFYSSHSVPCKLNNEGFCVSCDLRELVELSLVSPGRVVSPWKLVNNLSHFSSSFRRFQQEDAHEFLQCFLDRLENSENASLKKTISSQNDNFVKQVFGGRLVSRLKCCECGHCSDTYEPSIDLSLEIEDANSLLIALQCFTKVEKIEDLETKFTCEGCKEQVSVEKQLTLDHAPSIAAFHLKRFKNDGCHVEKIDKHVAFPLELDMLSFTRSDKTSDIEVPYELYAVVVHVGFTSTSGHYYCFIRISPDTWCQFDDSKVVRVHESFVLSQEAYILFYAKKGTTWFSNFIESQKLGIELSIFNNSPKSVLDNTDIYASALQSNHSIDANERGDIADDSIIRNSGELKHSGVENNEKEDDLYKESALPAKDDLCKESALPANDDLCKESALPAVANNLSDAASHEPHEVISSSYLEKFSIKDVGAVGNDPNITPQTPQGSSSPEIYREEQSDPGFYFPSDHSRLLDSSTSCKRKLEKDLDDVELKEACSFIRKRISGSKRQQQLLAALPSRGSRSEGAVNKKSKRMTSSPSRGSNSSASRDRLSIGAKLRPLFAGALR